MNVKGSVNSSEVDKSAFENSPRNAGQNHAHDDAIKASILSTLTWFSHTPIDEVRIIVKAGYVELKGSVQWMYQKTVIAAMVQRIEGVMGIINNIGVENKFQPETIH